MSGRNLREFIVSHRSQFQDDEEQKHLRARMIVGMDSDRYRKINYNEAKQAASKFRDNAQITSLRLGQLRKRVNFGKEMNMVKQHYPTWQQSYRELRDLLREAEFGYKSVFGKLMQNLSATGFAKYAEDLEEHHGDLDYEIKKFSKSTVFPIQQLINDLKIRMHNAIRKGGIVRECLNEDGESIMKEINSVKEQCMPVTKWLARQRMVLESDLIKSKLVKSQTLPTLPPSESAIPMYIVLVDCPDQGLKSMILRQFVDLYANYSKLFREQQIKFEAVETILRENENSWVYSMVFDIYHRHSPDHVQENLHSLIIDMMVRLLPHKTKKEIFEMESYFLKLRYLRKHCEALLSNYNRDLCNLCSSAMSAFVETQNAFHEANLAAKGRARQQRICNALHDKMLILKEKREEMMRLEAELEARKRMIETEDEEKMQWLENERRLKIRREVTEYRRKKISEVRKQELDHEEKLQILKMEFKNQRKIDQERVKFRVQKQKVKDQILIDKKRAKVEQELDRKQRLDDLRQTVAVTAESDPARLVAETVSSKARLGIGAQDDITIQAPLFNLFGYSQKEINGDVRLRVETALRNAGIHQTEYARQVMSKLPPPTQPRRDNDSSSLNFVFKN